MPELPDIVVYLEHLRARLEDQPLEKVRIPSPFLVRSVSPRPSEAEGSRVRSFRRIGKRLVLGFERDLFFVIHLMIAGRLRWKERGVAVPRRLGLAAFDFPNGTLLFTEAGTQKRASLHVVRGEATLAEHDPGGIDVFSCSIEAFADALRFETHTLKRTLTDPRVLSGIGNAYSDEILHRARLSPLKLTDRLTDEEISRLLDATRAVLTEWTERLRAQCGDEFPDKVTAFHDEMAVHGKYRKPCPTCGDPVQRIVYATNETNYCATCQTGGRLLADRALSRLLRGDWPRTLEELESLKRG
jgi:formamidopyrimidine-DNA glycosylase